MNTATDGLWSFILRVTSSILLEIDRTLERRTDGSATGVIGNLGHLGRHIRGRVRKHQERRAQTLAEADIEDDGEDRREMRTGIGLTVAGEVFDESC